MEEGFYSIVKSVGSVAPLSENQKIAMGLKFPIYIITSSYNSPHLNHLKKVLEKEKITISFQNSLEKFQKIGNTYQTKFFIILNDFKQTPTLRGEYLKLNGQVIEYPKIAVERILEFYRSFVQKEKLFVSEGLAINKNEIIYLTDSSHKIQNASLSSQSNNPKVRVRSISKMIYNYKTSFPKKIFIYTNAHDDEFFVQCKGILEKYEVQNSMPISRIEEYLKFLPTKEDVKFIIVMSEYSAINLRKYFKRCDEIVVCAKNPQNSFPLLRGKVAQIICDFNTLDSIIVKSFGGKIKSKQPIIQKQRQNIIKDTQAIVPKEVQRDLQIEVHKSVQLQDCKESNIQSYEPQRQQWKSKNKLVSQNENKKQLSRLDNQSNLHMLLYQIFNTKKQNSFQTQQSKRHLNIQSSTINLTIPPSLTFTSSSSAYKITIQSQKHQIIPIMDIEKQKPEEKIEKVSGQLTNQCTKLNNGSQELKKQAVHVNASTILIKHLEHLELAQCNISQISNESFTNSVFTEVSNTYDNHQSKNRKMNNNNTHNIDYQGYSNLSVNQSEVNCMTSNASSRKNRNSRIIQRYREFKKKTKI